LTADDGAAGRIFRSPLGLWLLPKLFCRKNTIGNGVVDGLAVDLISRRNMYFSVTWAKSPIDY
jgi:hypothetical protein